MRTALSIAGRISSAGAGIQADIKTMTANGVYARSVIPVLTAQNTTGAEFPALQLDSTFIEVCPDAVKTGTVPSVKLTAGIAEKPPLSEERRK